MLVAIQLLKDKPPGSFVVRNSSSFQGSFGLAVKVAQLPPNIQVKGGLYGLYWIYVVHVGRVA